VIFGNILFVKNPEHGIKKKEYRIQNTELKKTIND
jgi:hypothetical protein